MRWSGEGVVWAGGDSAVNGGHSELEQSSVMEVRVGGYFCKKSPVVWGATGATRDPAPNQTASWRKYLEKVVTRLE